MSSDSAKERVQRAALEGFAIDGSWCLNVADVRRRSGISTGSLSALGFDFSAPVVKACAPSEELPLGVKACVYE